MRFKAARDSPGRPAYGYSYTTVMPGVLDADAGTQGAAVIRGRSPRDMYAVFADPVEDEYPLYYLAQARVALPDCRRGSGVHARDGHQRSA